MKPMLPTSPDPPADVPMWRHYGAPLRAILVIIVVAGSAAVGLFVSILSLAAFVRWLWPGSSIDFMYGVGDYGVAGMVLGAVIGTVLAARLTKRLWRER
jgi:hypothetical protein